MFCGVPRVNDILGQVFLRYGVVAACVFTGSVDGDACELSINAFSKGKLALNLDHM